MYAKSRRPSAKREVQKLRSAKRDDLIARPRRAQTCARSARWECAREAGRFFLYWHWVRSFPLGINDLRRSNFTITLFTDRPNRSCFSFLRTILERSGSWTPWSLPHCISSLHVFLEIIIPEKTKTKTKKSSITISNYFARLQLSI